MLPGYETMNVHDGILPTVPPKKIVTHNGDAGDHAGEYVNSLI